VKHIPAVADACQDPGAEVLQQDVRVSQQPLEGGPIAGGLQVQLDRLLPGVLGEERGSDAGLVERRLRAEPTGEVTETGSFDLDDLSAEEHQLVAAVRSRQDVCQVQDPHAVQRSLVHAAPW
jgi:hypothetical protein